MKKIYTLNNKHFKLSISNLKLSLSLSKGKNNPFMRWLLCAVVMMGLASTNVMAQTTLISSTGDGGFENATSTLVANGWTGVNGGANGWFCGVVAGPSLGTKSAWTGTNIAYAANSTANVNHFYRNITFPAGETSITLTFKMKQTVNDLTFDYLKLWLVPTATTPTAGTQLTVGQIGAIAGYDAALTTYTLYTVSVPASAAGTTQRLVFSWRKDAVLPHAAMAIDEISLISALPSTWNGGTSTAWATAANWTPAVVPVSTDNVVIATGTFQPIISDARACTNITLNSGTTLAINSTFAVSGNWTNNGTTGNVTGTGTVTLSGAAAIIISGSSSPSTFPNLTSTGAMVSMGVNTTVNGNMSVTAGQFNVAISTTSYALAITGNYSQGPGNFVVANGANSATMTVGGIFALSAGLFVLSNNASATGGTCTVTGTTTVSGTGWIGMELVANTTGAGVFNANSDATFSSTGATVIVDFGSGASLANNAFNVKGNFSKSGNGVFQTLGNGVNLGFVFKKLGTQTFSYSGANSAWTSYNVNVGSTLQLITNLTMGSTTVAPAWAFTVNGTLDCQTFIVSGGTGSSFITASGSTIKSSNTNGIVSALLGSISTAIPTRTFNNATNYVFNNAVAQTTNFGNTTMNNLTISNTSGIVSLSAAVTVNGSVLISGGGGSLDVTATNYAMSVGTSWTNNGTFAGRAGTVTFNNGGATSNQLISGTTTFYNLTCSAASTNYDFGSVTTTIANALSVGGGTMVASTSTVIFTGATGSMIGSNAKNFYNLQINSGAITNPSGGNITIANSYVNNGTSFIQTAINTTTFKGGGTIGLSGTGATTFGSYLVNGTTTINAGSHSFTVSGVNYDGGPTGAAFNGGTATVTMSGAVVIGSGLGTINFNNLTIAGSLSDVTNNKNFNVSGNWTNNGTYTKGSETITFNGTLAQTIGGLITNFNNLTITNNSGSGVTLDISTTVVGNLLITNSTLNAITSVKTLNIGGNLTLQTGGTMSDNCKTFLNITTNSGTTSQVFTGNSQIIKCLNLTSVKTAGSLSLTANTDFYITNDLMIDHSGTAVLTDNGNTLNVGDDAQLGGTSSSSSNFSLTGTLKFICVGATDIHLSDYAGTGVAKAGLGNVVIDPELSSIISAVQFYPTGGGQTIYINGNLTIANTNSLSTILDLNNNSVSLKGNWINYSSSGFTEGTGMVSFAGTVAQTITGAEIFNKIEINNANGVTINNYILVSTELKLTNGTLTTGANEVQVTSNAIGSVTGYSASSYIVGNLRRNVSSSGIYDLPVGNANYQLATIGLNSSTGMSSILALFTTVITGASPVYPTTQINGTGITGILNSGFWTITPDAYSAVSYDVTLNQRGYSNFSGNATQLGLIKRASSGAIWAGTNLSNSNGHHDNTTQSIVGGTAVAKRTAVTSFSDFAIGFGAVALPVELTTFTATAVDNKQVDLFWNTEAELNCKYFSVQRSVDGSEFAELGNVMGNGTSQISHDYTFIDQSPLCSVAYYRLMQVDENGDIHYTPIAVATINCSNNFSVYPNPTLGNVMIDLSSMKADNSIVKIIGLDGRIYMTFNSSSVLLNIDASKLPAGLYFVNISNGVETLNSSFIKK